MSVKKKAPFGPVVVVVPAIEVFAGVVEAGTSAAEALYPPLAFASWMHVLVEGPAARRALLRRGHQQKRESSVY